MNRKKLDPKYEKIITSFGPSQLAEETRDNFFAAIQRSVDDFVVDPIGNGFGIRHGNPNLPRIAVWGHADSIGFLVKLVDEAGQVRLQDISGFSYDLDTIQNARVVIQNQKTGKLIPGTIKKDVSAHQAKDEDSNYYKVRTEDFVVRIGTANKEEALKRINILDFASYEPRLEYMHSDINGTILNGTFLDDRIGLVAVADLARRLKTVKREYMPTMIYGATISEETVSDYSGHALKKLNPHIAINVDVTPTMDSIQTTNDTAIEIEHGSICTGKGPALTRGQGVTDPVYRALNDAALGRIIQGGKTKRRIGKRIPLQYEVGALLTENQSTWKLGMYSGLVSIPASFLHSPHEECALVDVWQTVRLLERFTKMVGRGDFERHYADLNPKPFKASKLADFRRKQESYR